MENTEMKNGETDAVVSIIAWLDEWIDRTEKTMSAGEDDFSCLPTVNTCNLPKRPLAHDSLRGTDECTVRHLAEWCGIRKREAKNSLQRLLESNIPYGDDSITCADSRRFAYQTIIDRCEEEDKEVRK